MAIKYVAYNEDWDKVTGTLEIESMDRAQEALSASNLVIISLKKQRKGLQSWKGKWQSSATKSHPKHNKL